MSKQSKKALIVVTAHSKLGNTGKPTGWYLPEVAHVYFPLTEAGYQIDFASVPGGRAPIDPGSAGSKDPLDQRFLADRSLMARLDVTLALETVKAEDYRLIFFAGGHGTMWDFPESLALQRVTAGVYEAGGIVAAVCHGPAALVNVKLSDGRYLVDGQLVNSFTDEEERLVGLTDVVPFALESALRARGARFEGAAPWSDQVVVSGRLVTGQNPQSALSLGRKLVELTA